LKKRALSEQEMTTEVISWDEVLSKFLKRKAGFASAHWDGTPRREKIKEFD